MPFPSPGGPLEPGLEAASLASPAIAGGFFFTTEPARKPFPHSSAGEESAHSAETWARSLGWEDPLETGKATHSSVLVWRGSWTV